MYVTGIAELEGSDDTAMNLELVDARARTFINKERRAKRWPEKLVVSGTAGFKYKYSQSTYACREAGIFGSSKASSVNS